MTETDEADFQTLTDLIKSMSQQEPGSGYLIPNDMLDGLIEKMKHQPKDRLFSDFMAERGYIPVVATEAWG